MLVWNFGNAILKDDGLQKAPALQRVMQQCFDLFGMRDVPVCPSIQLIGIMYIACYTMDTEAADFQRSGYLSSEQAELLRSKVDELLTVIRPQAVPLVDSFKLPDYLLNSALGRDDGEVYRALFDFAIRERMSFPFFRS